jgi:general nucleoside transport system permease protein
VILATIVDADLFASAIRIATPVLFAALGGLLCMRAGVYNIALEGQMLAGAFAAIAVTQATGSTWLGILGGLAAGVAMSLVFAVAVVRFKANDIVASLAVNLLASGLTAFLLTTFFDVEGVYRPENFRPLPAVQVPLLGDIPAVGDVLSGQTPLVYLGFFLVAALYVLIYRRPFGLALRAVGEHADAARTSGISPARVKTMAIALSGALCGLGGAHLSLGYASEFTNNMTQGRGFTAFAAAVFGQLDPFLTMLAALLFGFAEALGVRVQLEGIGLPPSIVQMLPYLLALLALTVSSAVAVRRMGRTRHREMAGEV